MSLAADVRIPRIYMSIYKLKLSSFRKNQCLHAHIYCLKKKNYESETWFKKRREKRKKKQIIFNIVKKKTINLQPYIALCSSISQ